MHLMTNYIAMTVLGFAVIACTKSAQTDTNANTDSESDSESECMGKACLAHDTETATAGNDSDTETATAGADNDSDSDSNADTDSASETDSQVSCFDQTGDACAEAGCYPVKGTPVDRENACRGSAEVVDCVPQEQSGCFTVVTAAKDAEGRCWVFGCSLTAYDMTYLGWDDDVLLANCGYTMSDIWDLPTCAPAQSMR